MAAENRRLRGAGAVAGTLWWSEGAVRRWQKDGSGQQAGMGGVERRVPFKHC